MTSTSRGRLTFVLTLIAWGLLFGGQTIAAAIIAAASMIIGRLPTYEAHAMLKIYDQPTFTRTVYIEQPSRERLDGTDRDPIKVTYNLLDDEQLTQLGEVQKQLAEDAGAGGPTALQALGKAIDAVVHRIEGFGDQNGNPIEGDDAIAVAKRRWNIGRQINDAFWKALEPKGRAKN